MIDLYDLYQDFKSYCNTAVGGWFRPQSDFQNSCNSINTEMFVKFTGEAEKSQEAKDNLFPFLISKNILVSKNGPYGTFQIPVDDKAPYGRFAAARIIVGGTTCIPCQTVNDGKCSNGETKSDQELTEEYFNTVKQIDVKMIDDAKWGAVNNHKTKCPTLDHPVIRQINQGFEVSPRTVTVVVLDYYRQPKKATFAYTITPGNVDTGSGDDLIYDKEKSQPLEWPENLRKEFIIRLGERYGLFTRDQFMFNAASQEKKTA